MRNHDETARPESDRNTSTGPGSNQGSTGGGPGPAQGGDGHPGGPRSGRAARSKLIQQYHATSISGVPTTYQMICEHPDWARTEISSLRLLTCGGSAVPTRVLDAYAARGLSFTGGYGMTETSPAATSLAPRYSREKAGSAGVPRFITDVRVADVTDACCHRRGRRGPGTGPQRVRPLTE